MNSKQVEEIFEKIVSVNHDKIQKRLIKANDEITAIQREEGAYYDGAWEMVKQVINLLKMENNDVTQGMD